jgi:hypothetical protein
VRDHWVELLVFVAILLIPIVLIFFFPALIASVPALVTLCVSLIVSTTLSVLTLIRAYRGGKITRSIADDAEHRMMEIAQSVSTRTLVQFPDHISEITNMISRASQRILILTEGVDYGSFRDFKLHEELLKAIMRKGQHVKQAKFLIWEAPASVSRANKFRSQNQRIAHREEFLECVDAFRKELEDIQAISSSTLIRKLTIAIADGNSDWRRAGTAGRILESLQRWFHDYQCNRLIDSGVDVLFRSHVAEEAATSVVDEIPPPPEYFFWIVDHEAIFILPYLEEDAQAFYTREPALVRSFEGIFVKREAHALRLTDHLPVTEPA